MNKEYPIERYCLEERIMPSTKASRGGRKITVTFTIRTGDTFGNNEAIIKATFHKDRVFLKGCTYRVKLSKKTGHFENINYSHPIKTNYAFDMCRFGFDHNGESIPTIELVNLVLKMFTNYTIMKKYIDGPMYLIRHS